MQETYTGQENKTLEEIRIYSYKALSVETKSPDQVFEDYDPNAIHFKIIVWDEV